MTTGARILGLSLAIAAGGCGLLYNYGDYEDAPTSTSSASTGGSGGATSTSTASTSSSSSSSGGCTPPGDIIGDCQKPACIDGVPTTAPDDTDKPTPLSDCQLGECDNGVPVYPAAPDKTTCASGVCHDGACVQCIDAADCGGQCCLLPGNVCTTASPSCTDGCQDGTETGLDCGGGCPAQCPNGGGCQLASDCVSGYCDETAHCAPCQSVAECNGGCCHSGVCGMCP